MCTVTFLPQDSGFVLTSNRDEALERPTLAPQIYNDNGVSLLFPKDEIADGTWIGVSSSKRLVCLLNGGFKAHQRAKQYRLSRGVVVKDVLKSKNLLSTIYEYRLEGVEPFTIVIVDWNKKIKIYELVWDGVSKHLAEKPQKPTIWSSSLLYTAEIKEERQRWFLDFLGQSNINNETILHFHKTAGNGDAANNLVMKRSYVSTKSITMVSHLNNKTEMYYEDLQKQTITNTIF